MNGLLTWTSISFARRWCYTSAAIVALIIVLLAIVGISRPRPALIKNPASPHVEAPAPTPPIVAVAVKIESAPPPVRKPAVASAKPVIFRTDVVQRVPGEGTSSAGAKHGFKLPPLEFVWQGGIERIVAALQRRYQTGYALVPTTKLDHVVVSWDGRTCVRFTHNGYRQLVERHSNLYATLPPCPDTDHLRERLARPAGVAPAGYTVVLLAGRELGSEIARQLAGWAETNKFDIKRIPRARVRISVTPTAQLDLRVEVTR